MLYSLNAKMPLHSTQDGFSFAWPSQHSTPEENVTTDSVVATVQNVVDTILTEQISQNSTQLMETSSQGAPLITESISDNSSLVTQMVNTNNTLIIEATTVQSEILTSAKDFLTTEMASIENITKSVNERSEVDTTASISSTLKSLVTESNDFGVNTKNHGDVDEDNTNLYIFVGAGLGVLLLLVVVVVIIYKRYKTRHRRSGVYCLTELNERHAAKNHS